MKFSTVIVQSGNNTGIHVPDEVVSALSSSRKPAVRITINGKSYRSSVATMGGRYMVSLSAANRALVGAAGGDEVEVDIELDDEPREVTVPADLAAEFAAHPLVEKAFAALSYSRKRALVDPVEAAKTPETRQRRIDKAITSLQTPQK